MRLAFMGTPDFAVPSLHALIAARHDVVAVYTRPPRPAGRGKALCASPVHKAADTHAIEVRSPSNFRDEDTVRAFRALELDAAIVVAYGVILPPAILGATRLGCFNLHASLLPRWRGAAPIQRAIMAGDAETGVQIMRMEEGLDTGPILLSETVAIDSADTAGALHDRLAIIGSDLIVRALAALERGAIHELRQPAEGVTYARKISSSEARIEWVRPAREIDRQIRGLSPHPGAWFEAQGARGMERIKVLTSHVTDGVGEPGEVLRADVELIIACGEGALALDLLQRQGRTQQSPSAFLRGFAIDAKVR